MHARMSDLFCFNVKKLFHYTKDVFYMLFTAIQMSFIEVLIQSNCLSLRDLQKSVSHTYT